MHFLCDPSLQFLAFFAGNEGGRNDGTFKDGRSYFRWLVFYFVCNYTMVCSVISISSSPLVLLGTDCIVHFQTSMLKQIPQACEPFVKVMHIL